MSSVEETAFKLSHAKSHRHELKATEESILATEKRILRKLRVEYKDGQTTFEEDVKIRRKVRDSLAEHYHTTRGHMSDILEDISNTVDNRERCLEFGVPLSKVCTKCYEVKLLNEFYVDKRNTTTGHHSWCMRCHRMHKKRQRLSAA